MAAAARVLDVTRLVSRVGRGAFTGVDRVERAWLAELLARPAPVFAVLRAAPGYILLDRAGAAGLLARLDGRAAWGAPDWIARLHLRQDPARRSAFSDLRRLALAQAPRAGLARMLRRHLPEGVTYLNLGHSNLTDAMLAAVRGVAGARIAVMLHDTIPLDHPDFAAPGVPAAFAAKLGRVAARADLVIFSSAAAAADARPHLAQAGRVPPHVVAPLGVTPPAPDPAARPARVPPDAAIFLALGTIEPRKNHALLLDVWARLRADPPAGGVPLLCIVGARGWRNRAVFDGLDAAGADVAELGALDDGAVAALLAQARALLFPSFAEGYGLPPFEAMARGTPVICSDLPVMREGLGDYPVYADPRDSYAWEGAIRRLCAHPAAAAPAPVPSWMAHFDTVLSRIDGLAQPCG